MTKHYHVTPEQTLELANEVEAAGFDITVYQDGGVEGHTVDAFQALNNAALDKVLGEPVGYVNEHRAKMLAQANTTGWTRHTDWHFSWMFGAERMDWWPSGGKAKYQGKMVYGHKRVNTLIAKLKEIKE